MVSYVTTSISLPSGKLRHGCKPGSRRAARWHRGIMSGNGRGIVGSLRPVHKAHGCCGH